MRALLDINVLIALLDEQHIHHHLAHAWLDQNIRAGWASCPITENGFIRIVSQSSYPNPVSVGDAAARLREACQTEFHEYWADDVSLVDTNDIDWSRILGSRQITDVYLLALATHRGGRFVTLDRRVNAAAVMNASEDHVVTII